MTSGKQVEIDFSDGSDQQKSLVTRSSVPSGMMYKDYKRFLRYDFFHSCAYCTMSEAEAQALRFTIDHYEPRNARPDLENEYSNLMYACDECNTRKGDRCPPPDARADNHRFFRPDNDDYQDHFSKNGIRVEAKSNVGSYSIEALDLNRLALRTLRNIRDRLSHCDSLVANGVLALRKFKIDQLPPNVKGSAVHAIMQADSVAAKMADEIDELLRDFARSPLLDIDPEVEARSSERAARLNKLETIYPGKWRAPRKRRTPVATSRSRRRG